MMTATANLAGLGGRADTQPHSTIPSVNPRQSRLLEALLNGPVSRNDADGITGAANSPEVVRQLRALGIRIHCQRIEVLDRDGQPSRPGIYHLDDKCREFVRLILKQSA